RMKLKEYTNGKPSAECDLTYNKSQKCYVGIMNNTDGRKIDIRICGDEFNHPKPDIRFEEPPAPQPEEEEQSIGPADENTAFIQGSNVNIRKSPTTTDDNIITRLQNGTKVEVLDRRVSGDDNAMITRNETTLTTLQGQKIILTSGKAVTLKERKGRESLVSTDTGSGAETIGYVSSRDLRSVAKEVWFKIKFDTGEGWVFGDYLSRPD
ncbi:MAG: SH3 domain-containing protein, partial [Bacteroidetes bacterium]|nr:SH3 domain-containing protein [Bacteroidota bacterium]